MAFGMRSAIRRRTESKAGGSAKIDDDARRFGFERYEIDTTRDMIERVRAKRGDHRTLSQKNQCSVKLGEAEDHGSDLERN